MATYFPKKGEIDKRWYVVDADGKPLGRLASAIAVILMGKNKPNYTPFIDMGDYVVVINADRIKLSGNKMNQKLYRRHSGYPGGLKEELAKDIFAKSPGKLVRLAVWGMLPKNKLRAVRIKKLKIYRGASHPHQAQMPELLPVNS
jgi:large subunit ribosomal protein L13